VKWLFGFCFWIFLLGFSFADTYGDWTYSVSNNEAAILSYNGSGGAVIIPSEINAVPVKTIGDDWLFGSVPFSLNRGSITSIYVPDSVTRIADYAFMNLNCVTSVTIGKNVQRIGQFVFAGCFSLVEIHFLGNAPILGSAIFLSTPATIDASGATIYVSYGSLGWEQSFGGRPVVQTGAYKLTTECDINKGTISINPDTGYYKDGTTVVITANPKPGYKLSSWSGNASGTQSILNLLMDSEKSINAAFSPDETDTDGDGLSNYQEVIIFLTDPTTPETKSPVPGLFLACELQSEKVLGREEVINSPNTYSLYTSSQIHNLGLGGIVLDRNSSNELVLHYQIMQSTDLQNWTPYQSYDLPINNVPNDKMFLRVQAVAP